MDSVHEDEHGQITSPSNVIIGLSGLALALAVLVVLALGAIDTSDSETFTPEADGNLADDSVSPQFGKGEKEPGSDPDFDNIDPFDQPP